MRGARDGLRRNREVVVEVRRTVGARHVQEAVEGVVDGLDGEVVRGEEAEDRERREREDAVL